MRDTPPTQNGPLNQTKFVRCAHRRCLERQDFCIEIVDDLDKSFSPPVYICKPCWKEILFRRLGPRLHLLIEAAQIPQEVLKDSQHTFLKVAVDQFRAPAGSTSNLAGKAKPYWIGQKVQEKGFENVSSAAPQAEVAFHLLRAITERRLWCRYLRSRFRFDVQRGKPLSNHPGSMSWQDFGLAERALRRHSVCQSALLSGVMGIIEILQLPENQNFDLHNLASALRRNWSQSEPELIASYVTWPFDYKGEDTVEALREFAVNILSEWVRANIKKFPRIKAGIDALGGEEELANILPGLVCEALAERPEKEMLAPGNKSRSTLSRIAKKISDEEPTDQHRKRIEYQRRWRLQRSGDKQKKSQSVLGFGQALELDDLLRRAQLNTHESEAYKLREIEGMSYNEICKRTGRTQATVKQDIHRARKKLK